MKTKKIETKAEMAAAVADIARMTVELNILRATLDERIFAIKEDLIPEIEAAQKAIRAQVAAAKVWAVANKDEFGNAKSMDLGLAIVGFRTGMPKLSFLKNWTVEKTMSAILRFFPKRGYVRTKEELDKEALIADRDALTPTDRDKIGIEIAQEEAFFVDVKLEEASRIADR